MRAAPIFCLLSCIAALLGCKNTVSTTAGGGGSSGSNTTTGGGEPAICHDGQGHYLCGGPNKCPGPNANCPDCTFFGGNLPGTIGVGACYGPDLTVDALDVLSCADGKVFQGVVDNSPIYCIPADRIPLFCANKSDSILRYVDYSGPVVCGEPLPVPSTCPAVSGFQLCGPSCGACSPDRLCTGRSPTHPYSICVPNNGGCNATVPCATAGNGCFLFTVDAADQPLADLRGFCMPNAECLAAAKDYPGGAKCITGM